MAETKIYISDSVDSQLREVAMKRFGYGRGSISKAVETAIVQWLGRESAIEGAISAVVGRAKGDRNVIAVLLFGSYARKEPGFEDVDLALVLEDPGKSDILSYMHAIDDIGAFYKMNVDVLELNSMPIDMQSKVLGEAKVLYARDSGKLHDFSIGVINKWNDIGPVLNAALQ